MKLTEYQIKTVLKSLDLAIKYENSIADAYGYKGIVAKKAMKEADKFFRIKNKLREKMVKSNV